MKTYYLRLVESDFTIDDNIWTSPLIDLYDTASSDSELATPTYRNISTVKSAFGDNHLGNNTWTWIPDDSATISEDGYVEDGRYIDTTARIDLVNYEITIDDTPGAGDINVFLDSYTIDDPTAEYPEDWASKLGITPTRPIFWVGAYRYGKFVLRFETDQNISNSTVELLIRIDIGTPVMAPLYQNTKDILNTFPEWMEIREYDTEPATPEMATPVSLGAQFLNAVAGEWLDDLDFQVLYARQQRYITTADENQKAWVYTAANVPDYIWDVYGDGVQLSSANSEEDFYSLTDDEDGYWWMQSKNVIYTNKSYDEFTINSTEYTLVPVQVWNWFDEMGLLVDLDRLHLESNSNYKKRILDVYSNPPGVGSDAFKLALRRELDIWRAYGATPDSDYDGATPEVVEIFDIMKDDEYFTADGLPTAKGEALVDYLAAKYPITWGSFRWNKALWDPGGDKLEGLNLLPGKYDVDLAEEYTQQGIGDGNDLYVYRPDAVTGPKEFEITCKARGRHRLERTEYPEVEIVLSRYARADKVIYDNPEITIWFTADITFDTDSPTPISSNRFYTWNQVTMKSDADHHQPTGTYRSVEPFFVWGQESINSDLVWYDYYTGQPYGVGYNNGPLVIDGDIVDITLQLGKYNPSTGTYSDYPTEDVEMWVSTDYNDVITTAGGGVLQPALDSFGILMFKSNETESALGKWYSEEDRMLIKVNGAPPADSESPTEFSLPLVAWDDYLEDPPNKEYVIELHVRNGTEGIGKTTDENGVVKFLKAPAIYINAENSWVDNKQYFDANTAINFEATIGTSVTPTYPNVISYWELFEEEYVLPDPDYGNYTVDENGPWRDGRKQVPGNLNYHLDTIDLDRDDFGIPNTTDYIVTWLGVESNLSNIITWIDCNTVEPYDDDTVGTIYPDNVIEESYDEDTLKYYFAPINVRAKLKPGINPEWNPYINSGWYYIDDEEYYLYANPIEESSTATNYLLGSVARQGAPIIINPVTDPTREYRQVAFYDDDNEVLTIVNTETKSGTGTNKLYTAYSDIYGIQVTDLSSGRSIGCDSYVSGNEVELVEDTSFDREYEISYRVNFSFYADHEAISNDGNQTTRLVFDRVEAGGYNLVYEGSKYDPATPIDLALSNLYSVVDESFVYLSYDEYDLDKVEAKLSPSKLISDGDDYAFLSIRSYDNWGNAKPHQTFTVTTDYGTFTENDSNTIEIETNVDGFKALTLISEETTTSLTGTITITGDVSTSVEFEIEPTKQTTPLLAAQPNATSVPADGKSRVTIYGKLLNADLEPVYAGVIKYRRARSHYELFNMATSDTEVGLEESTPRWPESGVVYTNTEGRFEIGPFVAATPFDPGYWYVAIESDATDDATPETWEVVGDVVFWSEYPDVDGPINQFNQLQIPLYQYRNRRQDTPPMATPYAYPLTLSEATPYTDATPITYFWEPPPWWAIPKYEQYQLGLLGDDYYETTLEKVEDTNPDYKDY